MLMSTAIPFFSAENTAAASAAEVTMTIGVLQSPDTLNPFSMLLGMSYTVLFLMYDTLNSVEPDFSSNRQLATSWTHNEDGTVWDYEITPDAVWHDDTPLTAHDIAFTYNLIMNNENTCSLWTSYVADFDTVEATSDYHLRITSSVAKATMLSINVPILPKHIWEDIPVTQLKTVDYWQDSDKFPDGPVGSGPLILDSFVLDDFVKMRKWSEYFIDTVNMDVVIFKVYESSEIMVTALQSEYIDVAMGVMPTSWNNTLALPNVEGQVVPQLSLYELGINCASEEWREAFPKASTNLETTNLAVRQAIAMCVDEEALVKSCMGGYAQAGSSLIPTATPFWHYDVPDDEIWEFNIQAAGDLLTAAGYEDLNLDGTRENVSNDVELDFVFNYREKVLSEELAAEKISYWLEQVGIKATPVGLPESQLTNAWFACSYDLYIWGWDADVDPTFMLSVMTTDQIPVDPQDFTKWSDCFYSNPYYDQLFIDQQNALDASDRQAIVHEMQQILYRDCPYIVMWYPSGLYAYRTDTFYNYPDMESSPGATPASMWFYFDVLPYTEDMNLPPENVNAGPDMDAFVGETLSFTGSAEDPNTGDVLSWSWEFTEPDSTQVVRDGQTVSYQFLNVGEVPVELTVSDQDGLSASDSLIVTVMEDISTDSGWLTGFVKDSSSAAIVGAVVTAGDKTKQTDAFGVYNFTLSAGTYEVNVTATGYGNESANVTVEMGVETLHNFTLVRTTGGIQGRICDSVTGEGVGSASVEIVIGATTKMKLTNETGWYVVLELPVGTGSVTVTMTGYVTNTTEATIAPGETVTLDVLLKPDTEDVSDGGISATTVAAIAAVMAVAAVAVVAMLMMKKRKSGGGGDQEPSPPGAA